MSLRSYLGGLALGAAVLAAHPNSSAPQNPLEKIVSQSAPVTPTSAPVCYNYTRAQKAPFERYAVSYITEWSAGNTLKCIAKNFDIDTQRDESSILYHLGQAAKIAARELGVKVAEEPTHRDIAGVIDCRAVVGSTKKQPLNSDIAKHFFMYGGADRYLFVSPQAQKKLAPNYPKESKETSGPNYLADILLGTHFGLSQEAVDFLKGRVDFTGYKDIQISDEGRAYTQTCSDGHKLHIHILQEGSAQAELLRQGEFSKLLPKEPIPGVFEAPRIRE